MADENQAALPEWKQKADKLNEAIKKDPTLGVQVVYRSFDKLNDDPCVVPVLVSEKQDADEYPYVIEEPPATMQSPKMQWFGENRGWYENDVSAQGSRITALGKQNQDINKSLNDLKQEHQDTVNAGQTQNKKIDQLVQLVTVTNANVGQIMAALKAQAAKPASPAQPSQASQTTTETKPQQGGNN